MTTSVEKNILIEEIIGKFSFLLSLAPQAEVKALDNALAKVIPALPTSVQKMNVGCKNDLSFVQVNFSFVVCPIAIEQAQNNVLGKIQYLIQQVGIDDLSLVNEALNALREAKPAYIKIYISPLPVMEIAPNTWLLHFYMKTA